MTKEEGTIQEGKCSSPHASNALNMARDIAGRTCSPHRSAGALPSSMSAVLSAKKHAEALSAVLSAKEHAEAEAARANASLLELRAQYDAMQRRYEESEAALERTRRAATEVSLEAAGWPLIAPLIRLSASLIR